MRIDDPGSFCLLIPTYQGTRFLRRLLDFLKAESYPGQVVLSDNSNAEHRDFVRSCPQTYPELWLEVQEYDLDIGFVDKLARSIERLEARYVMLCGQDDYIIPEGVEQLLHLIDSDSGLACVRGRVARFQLRPVADAGTGRTAALEFNKHPMLPYEDADPVRRVLAHMRAYTSTLYSLHRREQLLQSLRLTDSATRNVVFFQYLSSCITVVLGRVSCLDALFLARQIHAQSWSASLAGDNEHWPLLLTSPKYSDYYLQFRGALISLLAERSGASAKTDLAVEIDEAYVSLARRALCRTSDSDAGNDAFFTRLQTPGTPENTRINQVARFTMPYEGTY
jgi:glycosyltransferase domain-containing protein